jgi:hypothetical protein
VSNLFVTLVIAFVVIVIAIACLAIGWLITGKTKIERGACGRDPYQKRDDSCESTQSCDLCSNAPKETSFEQENELSKEQKTNQ